MNTCWLVQAALILNRSIKICMEASNLLEGVMFCIEAWFANIEAYLDCIQAWLANIEASAIIACQGHLWRWGKGLHVHQLWRAASVLAYYAIPCLSEFLLDFAIPCLRLLLSETGPRSVWSKTSRAAAAVSWLHHPANVSTSLVLGSSHAKAAVQCSEGQDLWDLADFIFRGLRLRRDMLATVPSLNSFWCDWQLAETI